MVTQQIKLWNLGQWLAETRLYETPRKEFIAEECNWDFCVYFSFKHYWFKMVKITNEGVFSETNLIVCPESYVALDD